MMGSLSRGPTLVNTIEQNGLHERGAWMLRRISQRQRVRPCRGRTCPMATILVVDDDRDTCEVVSRYLEKSGHHAVSAENGWEALLRLDAHTVNLILLDVMMPGMDG